MCGWNLGWKTKHFCGFENMSAVSCSALWNVSGPQGSSSEARGQVSSVNLPHFRQINCMAQQFIRWPHSLWLQIPPPDSDLNIGRHLQNVNIFHSLDSACKAGKWRRWVWISVPEVRMDIQCSASHPVSGELREITGTRHWGETFQHSNNQYGSWKRCSG